MSISTDSEPIELPQHHFVVVGTVAPDGTVSLWVDNATADARFDEGLVWVDGEWTRDDSHEDDDNKIAEHLERLLAEGSDA